MTVSSGVSCVRQNADVHLGLILALGETPHRDDLVRWLTSPRKDIEEDIEADLDVIDLSSEAPILSDAARRVMQFAQLSKFMKAGASELSATRRSAHGDGGGEGDERGAVSFSIGDLHRLVLELPSVPVDKLRRELDLIGVDTARALKEDDECLWRNSLKSRSAAMVAAARA